MSLNYIVLGGVINQNPEIRYTPDGSPVIQFILSFKNIDDPKGETNYIRISAKKNLAEIYREKLKKGDILITEGQLHIKTYTKEGQKRKSIEIEASSIQILSESDKILESTNL